jgi:septal ring factor EnvC (AmiA/AmiB activator)
VFGYAGCFCSLLFVNVVFCWQTLLLKRSIDRQVDIQIQNLEEDLAKQKELSAEQGRQVTRLRKERNEAVAARKESDSKLSEALRELEELKKELESVTLARKTEAVAFVSRAEEISKMFRYCLKTVGIDVGGPASQ